MGKQEFGFALKKEVKLFPGEEEFKIGSLSQITGVKAGTIRFYEKCGFLEPAKRLPNGYRVFCGRHIYQVRACRLVFGGFVNRRLRKISRDVLWASREWNLEAYCQATGRYLQAAALAGVTSDTIRNWERNGLFRQRERYEKRLYLQQELNSMYVIRLLLDNGYSMMAVRSYFEEYDGRGREMAMLRLMEPGENGDLIYQADRYMETLLKTQEKARQLCAMADEMKDV